MLKILPQLLYYSNVLEEQSWFKKLNSTTKDQIFEEIIGPRQRHDDYLRSGITSYYSLIIVIGVAGNILALWVIIKSPVLQTPSNLFLFNLAIVDLITLLLGNGIKLLCFK